MNRRPARQTFRCELLESRRLFSSALPADVGGSLVQLYDAFAVGSAPSFGTIESSAGRPAISIRTAGSARTLDNRLTALGLSTLDVIRDAHVVDGYLPLNQLPAAAELKGVFSITAIDKSVTHASSAPPAQANAVLSVNWATNLYGLSGAGVKIGVISDSVNQVNGGLADSVAAGLLPRNVQVLKDGEPSDLDEGRALLEEIHAIAPAAGLAFYSGDGDQYSIVTAIRSLKAAGCKVIVDDLSAANEPFFQDGIIGQAINAFTAGGGAYVSAVGNNGTNGFLKTHLNYLAQGNTRWVNFALAGAAPSNNLYFSLSGSGAIELQWDNPFNGITGSASANLTVLVYSADGTQLVAESSTNALRTGIPEQSLHLNQGSYIMRVQLSGLAAGATAPDMLKFVMTPDASGAITSVSSAGYLSSAVGHGAAAGAISVGAVYFEQAPPYSSVVPIPSEPFVSSGPVVYAFDANGQRLPSPLYLDKPDVSGVDGINSSFFGEFTASDPTGLPQFFGTSAAAGNVAGVVALIEQFRPRVTQGQILSALKWSATPLNGAPRAVWTSQGGFGLISATRALEYFAPPAVTPTAHFAPIAPTQKAPISKAALIFNEPVIGLSPGDFSLSRNGMNVPMNGLQLSVDTTGTVVTLSGLYPLTSGLGDYTLSLKGAGSGVSGAGVPLRVGASVSWRKV